MSSELPRYRFGPLERRGLIAGWRGGQVAAAAVSLITAVGVLRGHPSVAGLAVALTAVGLGLACACWPLGGRTAEQWAPVAIRWCALRLGGRRRHLSRVPQLGCGHPDASGRISGRPSAPELPPALSGCRVLQPPAGVGGMRIGVVHDSRARTYTAVVAVRSHAFALLGVEDKHRRVDAWARVLAGLAREGSAVHRVQWVERSLPDDGDAMARYLAEGSTQPPSSAACRSYMDLLSRAAPVTQRHAVLLAVAVHGGRSGRAIRGAGGGDEGACALLVRELRSLDSQLRAADITVEGTLAPSALAQVLRQAVDRRPRATVARDPGGGAWCASWPWPLASEATWSGYRTDGTCHATYWVAEWPRVDVGPDFLRSVLLQSGARRTVSLTMEPVSPSKATREVEHARTADVADAELRRRGGFMVTARRRREQEVVAHREAELADGHAQYRFSGFVTVTADSWDELESAAGRVEQAAGQAHLELRRLYGEQDRAFTWTLPLGRGLA